jgi:hypothetical protein
LSAPKFIQLAEGVRAGGANLRRKRKEVQKVVGHDIPETSGGSQTNPKLSEDVVSMVPDSLEELNLEVVQPGNGLTPSSGIDLLFF